MTDIQTKACSTAVDLRQFGLKDLFPFSFAVPSYIYPADISENLEKLQYAVDEIELLLFEGADFSNLPTEAEIEQFSALGRKSKLRYNIHLPLDMDICAVSAAERAQAVERLNFIVKLTAPLNPTTYTLHLYRQDRGTLEEWRSNVRDSLGKLIITPGKISVETLDYDLRDIDDVLIEHGCGICLDIGHIIANGYDFAEIYRHFNKRVTIFHLHGVNQATGKDHLALGNLPEEQLAEIGKLISGTKFNGTLSLEIFSLGNLIASVEPLKKMFPQPK
jgi:adenosylcobalamin phosphodiesterase